MDAVHLSHEQAAIEAAEQQLVLNWQEGVDRQQLEHSCFGMGHETAVAPQEEQEQVVGKVEEEEQPSGKPEESVVVRGYRVRVRRVRFGVRLIVGYSCGLDP